MNGSAKRRRAKPLSRQLAQFTRPVRYALTIPILEGLRQTIGRLPRAQGLALGRWLGRLAWAILPGRRRLATTQLEQAGLAHGVQARRLTRHMFESLGMNAVEYFSALNWSAEAFNRRLRWEGLENLDAALAAGKGAIVVAPHMGNWELMLWGYRARTGRTAAVLMAEQNNQALNSWLARQREKTGGKAIAVTEAGVGMVRYLRRGGVLVILADQDSTRSRGIFVNFFARLAYTPVGPAQLARMTGAPLVAVSIARQTGGEHLVHMEPALWPDPSASTEEDLARLTQAFTDQFEARIRSHPEQWVWIHNRWRHRPGQKIRIRSAGRSERIPAPAAPSNGTAETAGKR